MTFPEPKVEFVSVDQNLYKHKTSNVCFRFTLESVVGGGQRCIGSQEDATNCADWVSSIPFSSLWD